MGGSAKHLLNLFQECVLSSNSFIQQIFISHLSLVLFEKLKAVSYICITVYSLQAPF